MSNLNFRIEQYNRKRLRILTEIEGYQELIQFREVQSIKIDGRIEQLIDQYNDITKKLNNMLECCDVLSKLTDDRIV